jgi:hypothetical protein
MYGIFFKFLLLLFWGFLLVVDRVFLFIETIMLRLLYRVSPFFVRLKIYWVDQDLHFRDILSWDTQLLRWWKPKKSILRMRRSFFFWFPWIWVMVLKDRGLFLQSRKKEMDIFHKDFCIVCFLLFFRVVFGFVVFYTKTFLSYREWYLR